MSDTFCDVCLAIFQLDLYKALIKDGSLTKVHHASPSALFIASRRCRICKEIWIAGRSYLQKKAETQSAQKYSKLNPVYCTIKELQDIVETEPEAYDSYDPPYQKLSSSKTWFQLLFKWEKFSFSESILSYHLLSEARGSALVGTYEPSAKVDSAATWSLCKRWLQECIEHHDDCRITKATPSFYPTRLLELNKIKGKVMVRLVASKNEPLSGAYTTLSHCWGDTDVTKLTHTTLNKFKAGMKASDLPKLYQDAIKITLSLELRYIWIDSLCIVQDEVQGPSSDWMNESRLMGSVYSNSFCNIAASEASDSYATLFHSRDRSRIKPAKISFGQDPVSSSSFYLYPISLTQIDPGEPLSKRGWVLQEQLLPPRALVFTKQQVRWECRSKDACESFPGRNPPSLHGQQLLQNTLPSRSISQLKSWLAYSKPVYYFSRKGSDADGRKSPWESFWLSWKCVVEDYSARYISNPGDKVAAIAGLATLLIQKMQQQSIYMAGMWNDSATVAYELGWTVGDHTNGEPASRPKVYRAPTWAWPSMDGVITYRFKTDYYMTGDYTVAYVKAMQVLTVDGSVAGPIKSGFIDINGPLLESGWVQERSGPEDDLDGTSEKLYHLSLVDISADETIWGLTLRRLETGPDQGCYRRVGCFRIAGYLDDMSRYDSHYNAPQVTVRIV